jgi:hypothetical protein
VGSNLCQQDQFDATFNSININDLTAQSFDEIWCAGIQAVKWWANKNPKEDWQGIKSLLEVLSTVRTSRFVFISTVDVFGDPIGSDESTAVELSGLHPYGRHRFEAEKRIQDLFDNNIIVRLPGLFGNGLKKNVIYDFLHDNQVEMIHCDAEFQFYSLDRLSHDIGIALDAGLSLIHFATEPVLVGSVAARSFGFEFDNRPTADAPRYDIQSLHSDLWGCEIPYIQTAESVLTDIADFVARERARG